MPKSDAVRLCKVVRVCGEEGVSIAAWMSKGFSKEAEGAAVERGVGGNDVLDTREVCKNGGEKEERQDKGCVVVRHGRDD